MIIRHTDPKLGPIQLLCPSSAPRRTTRQIYFGRIKSVDSTTATPTGFQPIKPLQDRQDFGLKRRDTGHGAGRRDDERRDDRARRSWLVTRIPDTGAS